MIGNKSVLVPPNVLQNNKIIFIHDLYCYTMASMYELSQENGGNIPMFQNGRRTKPQMFLFYVALGMPEGTILHPNAKQVGKKNERKKRERRDREGRREGTLIINATGHRPFKIFKIKKKVLLSTRTFHFSSFLQFFLHEYYFLI